MGGEGSDWSVSNASFLLVPARNYSFLRGRFARSLCFYMFQKFGRFVCKGNVWTRKWVVFFSGMFSGFFVKKKHHLHTTCVAESLKGLIGYAT